MWPTLLAPPSQMQLKPARKWYVLFPPILKSSHACPNALLLTKARLLLGYLWCLFSWAIQLHTHLLTPQHCPTPLHRRPRCYKHCRQRSSSLCSIPALRCASCELRRVAKGIRKTRDRRICQSFLLLRISHANQLWHRFWIRMAVGGTVVRCCVGVGIGSGN